MRLGQSSRLGSAALADSELADQRALRYIERLGETAEMLRGAVDSPNGWSASLERFVREAEQR